MLAVFLGHPGSLPSSVLPCCSSRRSPAVPSSPQVLARCHWTQLCWGACRYVLQKPVVRRRSSDPALIPLHKGLVPCSPPAQGFVPHLSPPGDWLLEHREAKAAGSETGPAVPTACSPSLVPLAGLRAQRHVAALTYRSRSCCWHLRWPSASHCQE